ncbi:hypothetical protein KR054_008293 [Drosophila jambulina]|nr:hypothetical protein KR054_008293 [Drosophila jambulina]
MKLLFRVWLGFSVTMILPIGQCPRLWETTALSVYATSKDTTPGCCSSDWLTQLQQSWCPLLRLLILGLVTMPIYNVVLILLGWRFQRSTKNKAELHTRPLKRLAPQPPVDPPKPPPRLRRRPALTPPSISEPVPYPSHMNPFGEQEQYQVLRRNLQLVLKGLQNPPLEVAPSRVPEPIKKPSKILSKIPSEVPLGIPSEKPSGIHSEVPFGIPFGIPPDVASLCPSEFQRSETPKKKRSKVIFKRLWQRWRSRNKLKKSKKSLASVSSSSCCSTNNSTCFYVYLEGT